MTYDLFSSAGLQPLSEQRRRNHSRDGEIFLPLPPPPILLSKAAKLRGPRSLAALIPIRYPRLETIGRISVGYGRGCIALLWSD